MEQDSSMQTFEVQGSELVVTTPQEAIVERFSRETILEMIDRWTNSKQTAQDSLDYWNDLLTRANESGIRHE